MIARYGKWEFTKEKIDGIIDGKTSVVFDRGGFRVKCGPSGVSLGGSILLLESQADLEAFAKLVTDAWKEHRKLVPKIATNPNEAKDLSI